MTHWWATLSAFALAFVLIQLFVLAIDAEAGNLATVVTFLPSWIALLIFLVVTLGPLFRRGIHLFEKGKKGEIAREEAKSILDITASGVVFSTLLLGAIVASLIFFIQASNGIWSWLVFWWTWLIISSVVLVVWVITALGKGFARCFPCCLIGANKMEVDDALDDAPLCFKPIFQDDDKIDGPQLAVSVGIAVLLATIIIAIICILCQFPTINYVSLQIIIGIGLGALVVSFLVSVLIVCCSDTSTKLKRIDYNYYAVATVVAVAVLLVVLAMPFTSGTIIADIRVCMAILLTIFAIILLAFIVCADPTIKRRESKQNPGRPARITIDEPQATGV